jgi:hypothetical protein
MAEHVTLLRPDTSPPSTERGLSSALPPDLLERVRGRVRLLALFLMIGFANAWTEDRARDWWVKHRPTLA